MKTGNKLFWMLAASVLSFAGCEIVEVKDAFIPETVGSTFDLVADIAQTRTTVDPEDGYKVSWEEGDVIYMVTDDETWGKPYESSSVTNIETIAEFVYGDGKFTTEATIDDGEYTFNAMYCAADNKSWHRGAGSTHKLSAVQNQDCTNPTAHIKNYDALVGTFTATLPVENPQSVAMHHIYTLMQVNVKNSTGEDIEIAEFEMSASGTELAGIFTIEDFAAPSITAKSGLSESIKVQVTGGTVAAGESLPIYFVCAPFSSNENDSITFKVTDKAGNTYTKTVKKAITFSAGTYNTTPYTITKADEVEETDYSGEWLIAGKEGDVWYAAQKYISGNYLTVMPLAFDGEAIIESDGLQDCYMTITKVDGGEYDGMYTIVDAGGLYLSASSSSSNYMNAVDNPSEDSYWTIEQDEELFSIVATKSEKRNDMRFNYNNGTNSRVSCYDGTKTSQPYLKLFLTELVKPDTAPKIIVSDTEVEIGAEGGDLSFSYTLKNIDDNDLTVTVSDDQMLSAIKSSDAIDVIVYANDSEEERTAKIVLSYDEVNVTITITQEGRGDVSKSYNEMFSNYTNNAQSNSTTVSITGDACTWTGVGVTTAYWSNFTWGNYSTGVTFLKPTSADAVYLVSETLSGGVSHLSIAAAANNTSATIQVSVINVDNNNEELVLGIVKTTSKKTKFTGEWDVAGITGKYQIKITNHSTAAYVNVTDISWQ